MNSNIPSPTQAGDVYFPKRSSSDEYLETVDEYCTRMKNVLPNFPDEVLSQWFYRHCRLDIDDYAWLNYSTLKFNKEEWTSEKILSAGVKDNERVQINKKQFEAGDKTLRKERIESYFTLHHTWPIAPILLHNPNDDMSLPNGCTCTSPYHLIDGNNRLGIFLSLFDNCSIDKHQMHFVWIATANSSQELQQEDPKTASSDPSVKLLN